MFRHGTVSTEVDRKPFVFTLTAFVVSLAATVLLFVFGHGNALAVFAGILMAIVAIASGAVLFALLTDRAYIENDVLHTGYLFRKNAIPLDKIGKSSYKEDVSEEISPTRLRTPNAASTPSFFSTIKPTKSHAAMLEVLR